MNAARRAGAPLTKEQEAYLARARKRASATLGAIEDIERSILEDMAREGYTRNDLYTALHESRYDLVAEGRAGEDDYHARILPDDVPAQDGAIHTNARARFNELYEEKLAPMKDMILAQDKAILSELEQTMARDGVREAYLGGSLYRRIAGGDETASPAEQALWTSHRKDAAEAAEKAARLDEADFARIWGGRSLAKSLPLAYREGMAARDYLRAHGAGEETLEILLAKYSEYQGKDRAVYLRKLAGEAMEEKRAYEALETLGETNAFAAALHEMVRGAEGEPVTLTEEARLAADFLAIAEARGRARSDVAESILEASLAAKTPGLDRAETKKRLLGEKGAMPFQQGAYVTCEDAYKAELLAYDDALVAEGKGRSIADNRAYYNKLAIRKLQESGATDEEIKDILLRLGGIPETERTEEKLDRLLQEARDEQADQSSERTPVMAAEITAEAAARKEQEPVRAAWKDPAWPGKELAEETVETASREAGETPALTKAERRKERARAKRFLPATQREEGMDAEAFYDKCADEYKDAFKIPFNDDMDEQIILYMLAQGYEEREIASAVTSLSAAEQNRRQTNYGKNKLASIQKDPKHKDRLQGFRQKLVNAETNFLQTKHRAGKELTDYEEALVRKRDPVGVPQ